MLHDTTELKVATPRARIPGPPQLLASKLTPPFPKAGQIERPRLADLVTRARWARVIVIQAPAGFGKTTMMLQIRARLVANGIPCAWLTLDQADNDIGRFLSCLTLACERLDSTAVSVPVQVASQIAMGGSVIELMARFARIERPFGLFIDDFESIQNPAVRAIAPDGVDYAFDTTAIPQVADAVTQCLAPHAIFGFVGVPKAADLGMKLPATMLEVISRGYTYKGIIEGDSEPDEFIPQLIDLYRAGRFPFDRLIKTYPLTAINEAVSDQHRGACVKAVLLSGADFPNNQCKERRFLPA
jgi:hypothetical protein